MYLKNLSLRGFKTFADKTVIEFEPPGSVTAIVGPNGCGKSNLVDAIRWVLGEQNPKELRSSALEEVIFAGSSARKPLSLAEVSIDLDNTDNKIKTEFSELSVKRRTFRDGESEFFINKSNCRLKDIRDIFLDTGLGAGSYSIISQGQVDAILSSKPEDRREIFEEAAKINKYKFRKTAAERKLISTEQNMLRISDLKSEIANQLSILEQQAKKAAEFTELKEKLKTLEVGLSKKQIKSINEKKNTLNEKISALKSQMELGLNLTQQYENERAAKRESLRMLEGEIEGCRIGISSSKLSYEENKSLILLEKEKQRNLEERITEYETQHDQLQSKLIGLEEKLRKSQQELTSLLQSQKQTEKQLHASEDRVNEANSLHASLEEEISDLKLKVLDKESSLSQERNRLIELESNLRLAKEEEKRDIALISRLEVDIRNAEERLILLQSTSEKLNDKINNKNNDSGNGGYINETLRASFEKAHGIASKLAKSGDPNEVELEISYGKDVLVKKVMFNNELIFSGGIISGGSLKDKVGDIFRKEREILSVIEHAKTNQEVETKTLELNNLTEELDLTKRSLVARQNEINDITAKKGSLSLNIDSLIKEVGSLNSRLAGTDLRLRNLLKEKDSLFSTFAESKAQHSTISSMLENLKADIEKTGLDAGSIREMISSRNREEMKQRLVECRAKISELELSLPKLAEEEQKLIKGLDAALGKKKVVEKEIEALEVKLSGGTSDDRSMRDALAKEEINYARLESELTAIGERMLNEYSMTIEAITASEYNVPMNKTREEAEVLRKAVADLGPVNLLATEEFEKARERFNFIEMQYTDLTLARENLSNLIKELDEKARADFIETLKIINKNFSEIFATLFEGGEAKLELPDGVDVLEGGIEIVARPGGKKWLNLSVMSGGERALTAIALLFALLKTHPSPFCLLDEADAALDEANVHRYTKLLKEFSKTTQVVLITHNKQTMEIADTMYGITMEEPGVSRVVSVKLAKAA